MDISGVTIGFGVATMLLAIGLGYALYSIDKLKKRFEAAFGDLSSDDDLLTTIEDYYNSVRDAKEKFINIQQSYEHLSTIASKSLQKTAVVRFNPFRNTGGDQSFVLALLDNHDSGFLLTSIHSREGTRVYIKPIKYGSSEHTLSLEEQSALTMAQKTDKKKANKGSKK